MLITGSTLAMLSTRRMFVLQRVNEDFALHLATTDVEARLPRGS